ncbi:unnamed protein product [Rotaria sordida]|uniref:Dynamin N-terminal domain-containing protein n=2 Tax=Rotaria sordida TaxID=392033 RepID=A0A814Z5W2_9BILA|nr:unnamed protein product [Rotaria sordida]
MDGDSEESVYNHDELTRIIYSNHQIRHMVQQKTNEFLSLQRDFFKALGNERFDSTLEQKSKLLTDSLKLDSLNEQVTADKVQLALVGENSCGKTALVHFLLDSGQFLPSDVGSVSARVIRLTYSSDTESCLRVYESLEKRNEEPTDQISLRDCFLDSEPDWNALKNVIESYVKRPDAEKVEKDSYQFAEWAKRFVEIRIPSKFLKLGIDLYDTPGLLYSDPPILKKNLHDLVKLIRPTVVFMYENPSVPTVTKDCFLALKEALGKQLEDTNIFFLNTKVDIGSLITNGTNISKAEFEIIILNKARQSRKDLLLKAPGMAQEIDDNNGFNIISVDSGWSPLGEIMNKITINHIIQFVANADLKVAKTINAHYHRKVTQLDHLRFLQLLHLYENENSELWMFFPKYESVENNIETLTVNSMFKIILTVAQCIEKMHASELVHGNINFQTNLPKLPRNDVLEELYNESLKSPDSNILDKNPFHERVQLVICGPNSSGKTTFLHSFLEINNILPIDAGPVTARIVKFTYVSPSDACLFVYPSIQQTYSERYQPEERVSLAEYFTTPTIDWKGIGEAIYLHVARPKVSENEFTNWARKYVEIRIPSPTLELGIDVYDTPGLLFHDYEILKNNLRELVKYIRPTLVFLYPNSTFDKDANESYLTIRAALQDLEQLPIFYLNTKQDITTLFNGAGIISNRKSAFTVRKYQEIFPKERLKRYHTLYEAIGMANNLPKIENDALMADTPHYPWRGCQCQQGGERGGHCHCPDHGKLPDTYCRYGGNHWICFPFSRRRSFSFRESYDRDQK